MKPAAILTLVLLWLIATVSMLLGWIAFVYAINVYAGVSITAEAALNLILTTFLAFVGLPLVHRAVHRWSWHVRRKQDSGAWRVGAPMPRFGSEPTLPPPRVKKTPGQIMLYVALYAIGIASLLAAYAPLSHQQALNEFLGRFSAGRASFSSLANLVLVFLPMALSFAVLLPFIDADQKRMKAGGLDDAEILRLKDRQEWLTSFATAFVMVGFLAFVAGNMILDHLG
jgi:hypothetical protein